MSSDERGGETGPVIIPVGLKPNKNRYFVCGVGSHCNQGNQKLKVVMKDDCHGHGPTHPYRNTVDVTWLGSELTLMDNKLCVEPGKQTPFTISTKTKLSVFPTCKLQVKKLDSAGQLVNSIMWRL